VIFNQDLLFIHVLKTGGMAMTQYLLQVLPRPVYYTHPRDPNPALAAQGIVEIRGLRHESAELCRTVMAEHGYDIARTKLIVGVIRNPYEIEVSRFFFLQKGYPGDRGHNQDLALSGDFEAFACKSVDHAGKGRSIESYFLLDGVLPGNFRVLRHENLAADLRESLSSIGIESAVELPHLNQTKHNHFSTYHTPTSEAAVYNRYRWLFTMGYYPRLEEALLKNNSGHLHFHNTLPVRGLARLHGLATGHHDDLWVGPSLKFTVHVEHDVKMLKLRGATPADDEKPAQLILRASGREYQASFEPGKSFTWKLPLELAAGAMVEFQLQASPAFRRSALTDNHDNRELVYKLSSVTFTNETTPVT